MRVIPLTQGMTTVVDAADFDLVAAFKWRASQSTPRKWYAVTTRNGRSVYMHRLLAGEPVGLLVDHRDGDSLNNRRGNLRLATKSQNGANSGVRKHNVAQIKGVRWDADRGKWRASITAGGVSRFLGRFDAVEDAAAAYNEAAVAAFGSFAQRSVAGADDGRTICLFAPPRGF